jgi:hypothetical protein
MAGLVPAIHVFALYESVLSSHSSCPALCRASTSSSFNKKDVDGRDKPGHDENT